MGDEGKGSRDAGRGTLGSGEVSVERMEELVELGGFEAGDFEPEDGVVASEAVYEVAVVARALFVPGHENVES